MPCYQPSTLPSGFTTTGRTGYATEAECNQACKEGACCEGTTCTVKPQCQCQGAGKTFHGVGTTCASISGACCEKNPGAATPTCSIKTACECAGDTKVFKGVGTTCSPTACPCVCKFAVHPTTVTWSVVQHPFDFRSYWPIDYDETIYGVQVKNGYSASGSFTLSPEFAAEKWTYTEEVTVTPTPNYIFSPSNDPSGRGGDYLTIPSYMLATVTYSRCGNGTYGHVGPHLRVSVRPPPGIWGASGATLSDEDRINNPGGDNPHGSAPSFTTTDGRTWQSINDPDCGRICTLTATWSRQTSFLNYRSPSLDTMFAPFHDISVTVSGCPLPNPLP